MIPVQANEKYPQVQESGRAQTRGRSVHGCNLAFTILLIVVVVLGVVSSILPLHPKRWPSFTMPLIFTGIFIVFWCIYWVEVLRSSTFRYLRNAEEDVGTYIERLKQTAPRIWMR